MLMRIVITIAAVALFIAHRYFAWVATKDQFEIVLLVVAALPWLGTIFKSIDIPGVGKFELQELKRQVAENRGNINSVRDEVHGAVQSLEQRADAVFQAVTYRGEAPQLESEKKKLEELGQVYVRTRNKLPFGADRTAEMSSIVGKMVAISSRMSAFDPLPNLSSADAGTRLTAYAYLYAKPNPVALDQLVNTVCGIENTPFGQYWGIRAITRTLEALNDPTTVSTSVKRRLADFCKRLPNGTDRRFELSKIASSLGIECTSV